MNFTTFYYYTLDFNLKCPSAGFVVLFFITVANLLSILASLESVLIGRFLNQSRVSCILVTFKE